MKKFWSKYDILIIAAVFTAVEVGVSIFINLSLVLVELLLFIALCAYYIYTQISKKDKLLYKINKVKSELDFENGKAFKNLAMPCAVVEQNGNIVWFNEKFENSFDLTIEQNKDNISEVLDNENFCELFNQEQFNIRFEESYFCVHLTQIAVDAKENVYILYFFDETELRLIQKEYKASKASVMISVIDNAEIIYQNFSEGDCASIFAKIEKMVISWAEPYCTVCRKISNARILILVEERNLQKMMAEKFKIIEQVREFTYKDKEDIVTLSIGVGREDSLFKSNDSAKLALDMAQSRGGDQVAIRHENEYKFYGGISQASQENNKVHTRLVAKSIAEIIDISEDVFIMGHKFSDFDAFASAVGMYQIAKYFGKNAKIVVNIKNTLAKPLIQRFADKYGVGDIISPDEAMDLINDDSLVIVVDTHKKSFCDCPELLDMTKHIIVIDHHRKAVDYIADSLVFYHMPNSSSASEMVTEIIQYIDCKIMDQETAIALLTGIVLDTRNFILRTSARTFEAAAFLKNEGASTVIVKKLFATDIEVFRYKNAIIDSAQQYKHCAIAVAEITNKNIRLISAQAADEMLNIDGVKASFVMYDTGEFVNISARSFGEINVQLVMESLGGGGHQSMSACQIYGKNIDQCQKILKKEIDNYIKNTMN